MKINTHYKIAKLALSASNREFSFSLRERVKRKLFCIGTLLPDLSLTQFIKPHFYEKSSRYVYKIIEDASKKQEDGFLYALRMGKMVHYLSDFSCKVHQSAGLEQPLEHMRYEREINHHINENFSRLKEKYQHWKLSSEFRRTRIVDALEDLHSRYAKGMKDFENDIRTSVEMARLVYFMNESSWEAVLFLVWCNKRCLYNLGDCQL